MLNSKPLRVLELMQGHFVESLAT